MKTREELEQAVKDSETAWSLALDAQDAAHTTWVAAQYALYSYRDVEENTK